MWNIVSFHKVSYNELKNLALITILQSVYTYVNNPTSDDKMAAAIQLSHFWLSIAHPVPVYPLPVPTLGVGGHLFAQGHLWPLVLLPP